MNIIMTGIDTNNSDLVNSLINVIQQTYPSYNFAISVTDGTIQMFEGATP